MVMLTLLIFRSTKPTSRESPTRTPWLLSELRIRWKEEEKDKTLKLVFQHFLLRLKRIFCKCVSIPGCCSLHSQGWGGSHQDHSCPRKKVWTGPWTQRGTIIVIIVCHLNDNHSAANKVGRRDGPGVFISALVPGGLAEQNGALLQVNSKHFSLEYFLHQSCSGRPDHQGQQHRPDERHPGAIWISPRWLTFFNGGHSGYCCYCAENCDRGGHPRSKAVEAAVDWGRQKRWRCRSICRRRSRDEELKRKGKLGKGRQWFYKFRSSRTRKGEWIRWTMWIGWKRK